VVIKGFPWRQTVCVRGHDHLRADGELVYENRYVIWGQLVWGRLKEYEVYEDTEKTEAFDRWSVRTRSRSISCAGWLTNWSVPGRLTG